MLFERGKRIRYSALLVGATVAVISPVTIRNWVVYHRLIPVAAPAGVNLVQGVAELDREGRFGMPLFDRDVSTKDVEWNGRTASSVTACDSNEDSRLSGRTPFGLPAACSYVRRMGRGVPSRPVLTSDL